MKAAPSCKSKFTTNLLLFRLLEGMMVCLCPLSEARGVVKVSLWQNMHSLPSWKEGLRQHCGLPFILINTPPLMFICKTTLMPLVASTTPLSLHSEISERLFFHQHPCREPHFSISGVRKGQGVKSIFQYYIFSTLLPVFWENWGSFAAWLSVYIFFTRLYWNYNCVLWCLLFGGLHCLKVLWTWGDEEKWTPFEGFDYWGRKCSCTLALFSSPLSVFLQVPISGDAQY